MDIYVEMRATTCVKAYLMPFLNALFLLFESIFCMKVSLTFIIALVMTLFKDLVGFEVIDSSLIFLMKPSLDLLRSDLFFILWHIYLISTPFFTTGLFRRLGP